MAREIKIENEAHVKREVKKLLNKHGWFWWMPPANGFGTSGISDFCALRKGVFLAVETKFGHNKPTAMQRNYLSSINAEDAIGFVVNEKGLPFLRAWLEAFDRACEHTARGAPIPHEDGSVMLNAIKVLTGLVV